MRRDVAASPWPRRSGFDSRVYGGEGSEIVIGKVCACAEHCVTRATATSTGKCLGVRARMAGHCRERKQLSCFDQPTRPAPTRNICPARQSSRLGPRYLPNILPHHLQPPWPIFRGDPLPVPRRLPLSRRAKLQLETSGLALRTSLHLHVWWQPSTRGRKVLAQRPCCASVTPSGLCPAESDPILLYPLLDPGAPRT